MAVMVKMGSIGMDERRKGVWLVGHIVPREIEGRQTDTVRHPHWMGSDRQALMKAMSLLQQHEPDLWQLFSMYAFRLAFAYMYAPGPILRRERTKAGMTQRQLSVRTGVSVRTIRRIENGHSEPKALTLARLVEALLEEGAA